VRDIAATLGRSEKATESLLSRARDAFRHAYGVQTHE
jgi:DNA-directed RNA polymerase specialized sigma24 family protein